MCVYVLKFMCSTELLFSEWGIPGIHNRLREHIHERRNAVYKTGIQNIIKINCSIISIMLNYIMYISVIARLNVYV